MVRVGTVTFSPNVAKTIWPSTGIFPHCLNPSNLLQSSSIPSLPTSVVLALDMTRSPSRRTDPCSLCAGQEFAVVSEQDRKGQPLATVACRQCGLVSHEDVPSDEELASYYQSDYRKDYHGEFLPSAYRVIREWKRGKELLQLLHDQVHPSDKVLEVGSGIGCTVKNFELAGYETSGIEPGEGFCTFSRERLHADVRNVELADVPRTPSYDFVLLVHVLEHFNDPRGALQHIRDVLRPGGRLYVEVPNFGAPHALPGKLFHYAHIYNYTVKTLTMLGQASGFSVRNVLNDEHDKNLRMVFERGESCQWTLDSESFDYSMTALHRYNWFTYHARWSYLSQRIKTLWTRLTERRTAETKLQQILSKCEQQTPDAQRAA